MSFSIHNMAAVERWFAENKREPDRLRRLRNAVYKRHLPWDEALDQLGDEERTSFRDAVALHSLDLRERHDADSDGTTKLLLETADGSTVEAVVMRIASGRTTLCVSSQVGCAVGCPFCATGAIRPVRNLAAEEILDAVVHANRVLAPERRWIRNVVFMGMGEPLHNAEAVFDAIEVLLSPKCFDLSPRRVMVSTVGIPDAMIRLARTFPKVRLAVSLHSARAATRRALVPVASAYDLAALHGAIHEATHLQQQPVMIEYLVLRGVNDSREELAALIRYLRDLPVRINLLRYNAIAGSEYRPGDEDTVRRFSETLKEAGFSVTTRRSFGTEIAAACGQLAGRQTR